jgi:hypothetical protein
MTLSRLLFLIPFLFSTFSYGQGLVILDEDNNDITADTLVVKKDAAQQVIKAQIYLHNDSDTRISVLARKIEVEILEDTDNTFCWNGLCFPPNVYEATEVLMINPGETTEANDFYGEYYPMGQEGITIIEYELFDADKRFETVKTTVVYDTTRDSYDAPVITFNIAVDADDIPVDQVFVITADQPIRHEDGSEITHESLPDLISFSMVLKDDFVVDFDAEINDEHTEITIVPTEALAFETSYLIEMMPVMGVDGEISEPHMIVFTTEPDTDTSVFSPEDHIHVLSDPIPNPATDFTTINYQLPAGTQHAFLELYSISGALLARLPLDPTASSLTLNTSELQNGIYFYAMESAGRIVKTNKLVVNK